MRGRLFLKVYFTLLASLALVALLSAVFVRQGQDEQDRGWGSRRDRFIAAMLPRGDDVATLQKTLDRLAVAFDADVGVYDPEGLLIASVGDRFPADFDDIRRGLGRPHLFIMRLDDGRTVAARVDMPLGPGGRNPLAYLAMIAAVIGVAAYPVVRQLTRRLESLRHGVEIWGGGELGTRVATEGRDEVAALARSFNAAADRIERLIEAHRALLANASHELRSPLARLRMAIDLYENAADARTKSEIVQNLSELDQLVEEILLASRLDHVQRLENAEPVDLLALAAEEGADHGIEVSGSEGIVMGDPRLLKRLIRNLMQNALRHGAQPVSTHVASDGRSVTLSVSDKGQGIAEAERTLIFEPFHRPAGRSESSGGWGLGLSLVRQIATHHKGTVRYQASPGGGASFVVELPVAP